jgi:prepilin-type N-terminal cleavage/methylation domain-containing protein
VKNCITLKNNNAGFTLVEIAVAVAILGLSLGALISLQSRIIDSYIRERQITRAILYGQYLMTMLEVDSKAPTVGNDRKDLESVLKDVGYFQDDLTKEEIPGIAGWQYIVEVASVDVAPLEDVLRRIDLSIAWGEGASEKVSMVYFAKPEQKQADDGA